MMANLTKLFTFTLKELFILFEAWCTFLKYDLLISFTKYENWRADVSKLSNVNEPKNHLARTMSDKQVKAIINLSEIAGRFHLRKMNCLRRCISQEKILEKRGVQTRMHIGVRFEKEKLFAHVWLTLQGVVINDSDEVSMRYSELKSLGEQDILRHLK
jgi:hypothetical protein